MRHKKVPVPREHGAWALIYAPVALVVLGLNEPGLRVLLFVIALTGFFVILMGTGL